jgi:hypothetical protein
MNTVPSNPVIYQLPTIYDNTVQYYWRPPVSNGGSNILGYYIECNTIPLVMNVVADKYWQKVGGLTNGKTYTFHVKAYNSVGNGNVSVFPDVTPNKKTLPPSNIDFTMNVSNVLDLNWTTSAAENFHPKNIEGLKLWLDASDSSNIILSNSNISGWIDKSEFRYVFDQLNISKRPFLSNINGINAIEFSGLSNSNSTFLSNNLVNFNNTRYTIFAVAEQNHVAPSGFNYLLKGGDINRNYYLQLGSRNGFYSTYTGNSGGWNDTNINAPTSNVQNTSLLSLEVSTSTLTPYFNGNIMSTKTGTTMSSMNSIGFNTSYTTNNITINGNQFTSTIGGGGWGNSIFVSSNAYQYFSATVSFASLTYASFGVSYSNTANYNSGMNYFFYFDSNFGVDSRGPSQLSNTTYTTTDIFKIVYDGVSVKFFKNNDIIAQSVVTLTGPVYLIGEIHTGNFLNNVTFEELAPANKVIGMTIGDDGILNGYNWNGKLGELLIYDSKLNVNDRLEIEGYLAHKWKITNNFVSTHPFKTIIPKSNPIFDPNSIGGLNFWIDASQVKNLANSSTVTSFLSECSFGNQGNFGSGSMDWINNAINNMPAYRFNGTSQSMSFGNILNLGSAMSIFIVTKLNGNGGIISKSANTLKAGRWAINKSASTGLNFLIDTNGISPNIASINDPDVLSSNPQIINAVWDKTNMYIYQNGECKRILSNPSNATFSTSDTFFIGVSPNSAGTGALAGTYMNGFISEILIYNKQLSQVERESVEAYLSQKWNIPINNFNLFKNSLVSRHTKVNPTLVPLIAAWYDGSDPLNGIAPTEGQQIDTWVDKSGNFRNATQTIPSNRPTYLSGGGLYFNRNSNQCLGMNVPYSDNHTVFLVSTPSPFNTYYFGRSGAQSSSPAIIDYGNGIEYFGGNDRFTLSLSNNILNNISANVANISADTFLSINSSLITPGITNSYTSNTTYAVQNGIVGLVVRMWGAGGGNVNASITGGAGAYVEGIIDVREGDVFSIEVGAAGTSGTFGTGGGRTAILKTNNANAIVCVAGSGGGAGGSNFGGVATIGSSSYSGGSSYANQVLGNPAYPGSEAQNGGGASQTSNGATGTFYGSKGTGGAGYFNGGTGGEQYNGDGSGGAGSSFLGGLAFTQNSMNGNGFTGGNSTSIYRFNNAGDAGSPGLVYITPIRRTVQTTPNNFIASYVKNSGGIIQGTFNGVLSNPFSSVQSYDNTSFNTIGNSSNNFSTADYLNGIIYELIIYNKTLSKDERQLIEGYLAHKWGLTSHFPNEHPYKFLAPTPKFFPSYIPSLNFWIDSSDRETVNSANSKVSFVYDKSGKGFNLDQYDRRYQPEINNNNLLSFTNNYHLNIPFRAINNTTGWSMILVLKPKGTVNYIMQKIDTSVNGSYNLLSMTNYFGQTAGTNYYVYFQRINGGTIANSNSRLATNNLQIIRLALNAGTLSIDINGTRVSTSTANYSIVDKQTGTCFTLGAWYDLSTFTSIASNFELAELLFYNTILNTRSHQLIEGYLAEKWNIQNYLNTASQFSDIKVNTSKIILSENLSNYVIDNILKIMPVDIRGNLITNDSANTIVNTMRGTFNNKSFFIPNNNWSYRASLASTSNIGHSDVVYTSTVFNPKIPSNGLKLWLDSYDTSSLTLSNNLVTKWNDKSKNFSNAIIQYVPSYANVLGGPTFITRSNVIINSQNENNIALFLKLSVNAAFNGTGFSIFDSSNVNVTSTAIIRNTKNVYLYNHMIFFLTTNGYIPYDNPTTSFRLEDSDVYIPVKQNQNYRIDWTGDNPATTVQLAYTPNPSSQPMYRPTYDSGNSLISFNGNQYLVLPSDTITSGNLDYTLFMYSVTSNVSKLQWPLYSGTPTQNRSLGIKYDNSNIFHSWYTTESFTNQPVYSNIGFVSSYTYSGGIRNSYINGYLVGTSNGNIRNTLTGNNYIGTDSTFANTLVGSIGDILIYNRILTTTERQSVEDYLKNRRTVFNTANLIAWFDASSFSANVPNILIDRTYNGFRAVPLYGDVKLNTQQNGIEFNGNSCLQINPANVISNPINDGLTIIASNNPSTEYYKISYVNTSNIGNAKINIGYDNSNLNITSVSLKDLYYPSDKFIPTQVSGNLNTGIYLTNNQGFNSNIIFNQPLSSTDPINNNGILNITYESPPNGWTPILTNMIISAPNTFRSIENGAYNNRVVSREAYQNFSANVNFSWVEYAYFGMTYDNINVTQNNFNFGFFKSAYPSTISVIESNNTRTTVNYSNEVMSIRYDGSNVNYYQNDTIIYTSNVNVTNNLYLFFNIWGTNQELYGINFGGNIITNRNQSRIPVFTTSNISIGYLPEYTTSVWFKRKGLCGIDSSLISDSNSSNSAVNMALYTQDGTNFRGGYLDNNFWTSNLANISIINNTYQKDPIGNSWFNSKLVSNESFFQPNATVSFSFAEYAVFGLVYNNNKDFYDETNLDYGLKYDVYSGVTTVIENGNVRANISNDTSSIFTVRSDNGNIIYSKDNNIFYTSNIKTNNKLFLAMNLWADNNYLSNIGFTDLDSLQRTGNIVSFPINEWHNMTMTVNNSFIKTYYDGNISNITINRGNISSSNNLLTIGGSWNRTSNILGDIGELLIYNKVLNDNEILNNFNYSKNKY